MARTSLIEFVEAVGEAKCLEDAAQALSAIGRELGLGPAGFAESFSANGNNSRYYAGLFADPPGVQKSSDPGGQATSVQRVCPVFRSCAITVDPFTWSVSKFLSLDDPVNRMLRARWERMAKKGVLGGLVVPVHMPRARLGAVGWYSMRPELDLTDLLAAHSHELRLAAQLFTSHAYRQRPAETHHADKAELTERELECLTWVAMGKTDSEIGELIGRSPSTARFHVDSAAEKLAVNNRARAAAVACQMGLVDAFAKPLLS